MNRYQQRNEVLNAMGYASYAEYLKSPLWASIRRRLFKACDTCPCGQPATEVHHTSYKRRYLEGRGKIYRFLIPLCRACHQHIEFLDDGSKAALGWANARLEAIHNAAIANGIKTLAYGKRYRRQKHKQRLATSVANRID